MDTSLVQMRTDKSVFVNHVFDVAEGGSEGIAAELQVGLLCVGCAGFCRRGPAGCPDPD